MTNAKRVVTVLAALLAVNALLAARLAGGAGAESSIAFLDVGQGDASLITLPAGRKMVQILIDGGPDAAVLTALGRVMPAGDTSIDLVMLTHPQLDHFGGLIDVVRRYRVGAFLWTGRAGTAEAWNDLVGALRDRNVPALTLGKGDALRVGERTVSILHPDHAGLVSGELNDSSLVARLEADGIRALFTGDIAERTERLLPGETVRAEILKVPHHGSKYSSSGEFLARVAPRAAFIEVGKNRYGHPTAEALKRLASFGDVFRTDRDGTVVVRWGNGKLLVAPSKQKQ